MTHGQTENFVPRSGTSWDKGWDAFVNRRVSLADNPYREGSFRHSEWREGWLAAEATERKIDR